MAFSVPESKASEVALHLSLVLMCEWLSFSDENSCLVLKHVDETTNLFIQKLCHIGVRLALCKDTTGYSEIIRGAP